MSRADIKAGSAFVELLLKDGQFRRGLKYAQGELGKAGAAMQGVGKVFATAGAAMALPFAVAIQKASDAQETIAKFGQVFGEQTVAAEKFATDTAKALGRSAVAIRNSMSAFQSFFVGLNFGSDTARQMSEQLQSLALDFAAFHNLADDEAMGRFISALSGSSEVLDQFGVNIKQAALQEKLLEQGITKSWTAVTEQEKAVARLAVIMEAMTAQGAVGAATREAGSFANRMKALKASIEDTAIAAGTALLPAVTALVEKFTGVVASINEYVAKSPQMVTLLAEVAVGVGGVGIAATALGVTLTFIANHPVVAVLTAIAAGALAMKIAFDQSAMSIERTKTALDGLDGAKRLDAAISQKQSQIAATEKDVATEKEWGGGPHTPKYYAEKRAQLVQMREDLTRLESLRKNGMSAYGEFAPQTAGAAPGPMPLPKAAGWNNAAPPAMLVPAMTPEQKLGIWQGHGTKPEADVKKQKEAIEGLGDRIRDLFDGGLDWVKERAGKLSKAASDAPDSRKEVFGSFSAAALAVGGTAANGSPEVKAIDNQTVKMGEFFRTLGRRIETAWGTMT